MDPQPRGPDWMQITPKRGPYSMQIHNRFVGFFFDNHGIDEPVDRALHRRSAVVGRINASRQCDETFAKIASRLMLTDRIFGIPKLDVHRFELG